MICNIIIHQCLRTNQHDWIGRNRIVDKGVHFLREVGGEFLCQRK